MTERETIMNFFHSCRADIKKTCPYDPGRLNGKACMQDACPYNGFCEAIMTNGWNYIVDMYLNGKIMEEATYHGEPSFKEWNK